MTEYGIAYRDTPNKLHRGPMTRQEAIHWITEDPAIEKLFMVVSREVSRWEPHTDRETGMGLA